MYVHVCAWMHFIESLYTKSERTCVCTYVRTYVCTYIHTHSQWVCSQRGMLVGMYVRRYRTWEGKLENMLADEVYPYVAYYSKICLQ